MTRRLGVVAGLLAILWAVAVLDPLGPSAIDPDASSSVLYFDRITTGMRLEAFVPTTPKPLLTLLYGLTWAVGHDWRWLVWETILAWGVAVGATVALVARLAGRVGGSEVAAVAAGAFAGAAMLTSSDLLLEVSRANSLIWAVAFWSLAGLGVTATPARPLLAGLLLLLGGLCRFETLALDAAGVLLVVLAARERHGSRWLPGVLAGIVVASLAVPVAMAHDVLLTGDPTYFLSVPGRYTEIFNPILQPMDVVAFARVLGGQLAPEWALIALAAVGSVGLARARQYVTLAALLALGLGVVALLVTLAVRGTYISNRYYEPIDLVLVAGAAIGVGWIAGLVIGLGTIGRPAALAAGAVLGAVLLWPALPFDRRATTELTDVRTASTRLAQVLPALDALLHDIDPPPTRLLVPSRDVARAAVEIPATLRTIGNSYALLLNEGTSGLQTGDAIFHDDAADRPVALFRPLEVDDQGSVSGRILVRLEPRVPGIWILSVR